MGIGLATEHQDLAAAVRGWARRHVPREVVRAGLTVTGAGRPPFWQSLAAQGLLGLHIPEEHGGQGFGLVEQAVALEELGQALAPGPYLPTVLAGAVILAAPRAGKARATELPGLASGSRTGAASLATGLTGRWSEAGLVVDGTVEPVLGAAGADVVVAPVATERGETWVVLCGRDLDLTPLPSLDPLRPVARVEAREARVPGDHVLDGLSGERVREVAAVLFGAEAAGLAAWAVRTAADHARVREQFGRPIGQFQAVKHRCAHMLVALEQARAVVWDAARAVGGPHADFAAAVAVRVALPAAVRCLEDCIQVLGGIGFTWEHDAHLYYRRALTLRALLGGGDAWAARIGRLALAGRRRPVALELTDAAAPARARIRAEVAELAAIEDEPARRARMAEDGWIMPHLPRPWGRGAGPLEQALIQQELAAAGVPKVSLGIGAWVVPTLVAHGTPAQRERFVLPTLRGELVWCQLFSEPGAGSDLASLSTRAERVVGGFRLTGQKIWTSLAQYAQWAICLARTDFTVARKHDGITYFLVDMSAPGVEVRPLREITGETLFNEVFLAEVFVPDDCVVGEVGRGWRIARDTLSTERIALSTGGSSGVGVTELLDAVSRIEIGPEDLARVGHLVAEGQAIDLLALRVTLRQLSGADPGAAASVRKLLGMRFAQRVAEYVHGRLGAQGAVWDDRAQSGVWARHLLGSRAMTIYGGTSEIQLNIIGERILGLPRDPEPH